MHDCCPSILLAQPDTPNGSPEDIIVEGVDDGSIVTGRWANNYSNAVEGKTSARSILRALEAQANRNKLASFAEIAGGGQLHGALLGGADSYYEQESGDVVEFQLVDFSGTLKAAIQHITGLKIFDRPLVQSLRTKATQQGFWIANLTNERMLETAKRELSRQVSQGADLRNFSKFVDERMISAGFTPANPSHVETIFRTNVMSAYNVGRQTQQEQPQVLAARPYWQVITVQDNRQRPTHGVLHRKVFRADDPAWKRAYPPFGYNCMLPGNLMSGEFVGASKAFYQGKAIELVTAKGRRTTVTANHPILTSEGFKPARRIKEGDDLCCDLLNPGVSLGRPGSQGDKKKAPARAEDVFGSLSHALGSQWAEAAPDNFHGEALFFQGQINVVGSYGELLRSFEPCLSEEPGDLTLKPSDSCSSLGEPARGDSSGVFPCSLGASHGFMSGVDLSGLLVSCHLGPLQGFSFGSSAQFDPGTLEGVSQAVSGDSTGVGEFLHRYASQVSLDEVVQVREFDFSDHVYDFETVSGLMSSDGIITSNCRCRVRSLPRSYKGTISPGSLLTSNVPDPGFSSRAGMPALARRKSPRVIKKQTSPAAAKKVEQEKPQQKPDWVKNKDGSYTGTGFGIRQPIRLEKRGGRHFLKVGKSELKLPKKATFDHAEGALARIQKRLQS